MQKTNQQGRSRGHSLSAFGREPPSPTPLLPPKHVRTQAARQRGRCRRANAHCSKWPGWRQCWKASRPQGAGDEEEAEGYQARRPRYAQPSTATLACCGLSNPHSANTQLTSSSATQPSKPSRISSSVMTTLRTWMQLMTWCVTGPLLAGRCPSQSTSFSHCAPLSLWFSRHTARSFHARSRRRRGRRPAYGRGRGC